jgi:ATP-dependent NAD(P)H-hydrate dehydratase
VHTILDSTSPPSRETLKSLISRLHVLVIGPGLGRDDAMQGFGRDCLDVAKELQKWVVLDADGLWMVTEDPKIIEGYDKAILTPNVMENKRLCEKMVSLTNDRVFISFKD